MKYNCKINGIAEVIRIEREIEQGITVPIECRLSNGLDAIVKYPRIVVVLLCW